MNKREIAEEFARRAMQLKISLWGLFGWQHISKYIKRGDIITDMVKANRAAMDAVYNYINKRK